jgi:hypothetical protein
MWDFLKFSKKHFLSRDTKSVAMILLPVIVEHAFFRFSNFQISKLSKISALYLSRGLGNRRDKYLSKAVAAAMPRNGRIFFALNLCLDTKREKKQKKKIFFSASETSTFSYFICIK